MILFFIGALLGFLVQWLWVVFTREVSYTELKKYSNSLDLDVEGFLENSQCRKRNLFNLIQYKKSLPKQCNENYKRSKRTIGG